jgi:hypothetical protein
LFVHNVDHCIDELGLPFETERSARSAPSVDTFSAEERIAERFVVSSERHPMMDGPLMDVGKYSMPYEAIEWI